MRSSLLVLSAFVIIVTACNKDKFQTKPTITVKSMSAETVAFKQPLIITLESTDQEGDVTDSVILIKKRLNKRPITTGTVFDTIRYLFPKYPDSRKVEIEVRLDYDFGLIHAITPPTIPGSNPPRKEPDSLVFRIAVRDRAGNTSDTIETRPVYIERL